MKGRLAGSIKFEPVWDDFGLLDGPISPCKDESGGTLLVPAAVAE